MIVLQGNRDQPPLQHVTLAVRIRLAEQRDHPLIRGQAQCPVVRSELFRPRGLPRPENPTIRNKVVTRRFCTTARPGRTPLTRQSDQPRPGTATALDEGNDNFTAPKRDFQAPKMTTRLR